MAAEAKKNDSVVGAVIAFAVMMLLGGWLISSCDSDDDISPKADARVACQDAVEARLKSPSTADFGGVSTDGSKDAGIVVTGHVDSENTFGATTRTEFSCKVTFSGDVAHAKITGLE
ncbi:hypothetical protein [Rhodococcus sp. 008]|uniref:hypothetical protein n=1 Tax=Rhodococcus sp. 008 TaxID=1723645 RepID=UPI000A791707|nr:hypothetical protein [Rhodococcus sp. 008]